MPLGKAFYCNCPHSFCLYVNIVALAGHDFAIIEIHIMVLYKKKIEQEDDLCKLLPWNETLMKLVYYNLIFLRDILWYCIITCRFYALHSVAYEMEFLVPHLGLITMDYPSMYIPSEDQIEHEFFRILLFSYKICNICSFSLGKLSKLRIMA